MKKATNNTDALIAAIDKQLNAILEEDVRKLHQVKDVRIKNAAFLQLINAA